MASGLWERPCCSEGDSGISATKDNVDWDAVFALARNQAISGLLAAGLESLHNAAGSIAEISVEQKKALARHIASVERLNTRMDGFLEKLYAYLLKEGLTPVLLKGQGLAQCYQKPLHRESGDIDLLFNGDEYNRAKKLLAPRAQKVYAEDTQDRHLLMVINGLLLELHGSLHTHLTAKTDAVLDSVQEEMYRDHLFRTCTLKSAPSVPSGVSVGEVATEILLPEPTRDVLYVFCHILQHLFNLGIGLKQVCDLARLLYSYRENLDVPYLESRLREMGYLRNWKVLAAFLKEYLGTSPEYIPFYDSSRCYMRKARRLLEYILYTGNMGKNRDVSYRKNSPYLVRKMKSMGMILKNAVRLGRIFPWQAFKIACKGMTEGVGDLKDGK